MGRALDDRRSGEDADLARHAAIEAPEDHRPDRGDVDPAELSKAQDPGEPPRRGMNPWLQRLLAAAVIVGFFLGVFRFSLYLMSPVHRSPAPIAVTIPFGATP